MSPLWVCLPIFFILHCKDDKAPPPPRTRVNAGLSLCGTVTTQVVKDAFGLGPVVPVDANNLKIEQPGLVVMQYGNSQSTLLLQITPITTSNANEYPDYVNYKITDTNQKQCTQGQIGSSLFKEAYIPSSCGTGSLILSATACTATPKDSNVPCGPAQTIRFKHDGNTASAFGDVMSEIQETKYQETIVSQWLSGKAADFLSAVGNATGTLSSSQQMEISLAQEFTREKHDFSDIFSSSLYDSLLVQSQELKSGSGTNTNMQLADDGCAPAAPIVAASPDGTLDRGMTTVDGNGILSGAKNQFGAKDKNAGSLFGGGSFTDTNNTTASGDIANGAKKTDVLAGGGINGAVALGAAMIAVGVVWGVAYVAKGVLNGRNAAKTAKMQTDLEGRFNLEPYKFKETVAGKLEDFDPKKVEWVSTPDGKAKIFTYNKKLLVEVPDPAATGKTKLELRDPKPGELAKENWYGDEVYKDQKVAEAEGKPIEVTAEQKANLGESWKETKFDPEGAKMHGAAVVSLIALGGFLAVVGSGAVTMLAGTDPYKTFLSDVQSAQQTLDKLRAQLADLESQRTQHVLDEATGTAANQGESDTATSP